MAVRRNAKRRARPHVAPAQCADRCRTATPQGRLCEQIANRHIQDRSDSLDDRQPIKADPVVLDLAQPVDGAADAAGENLLRHATTAAVPGDPLADRQVGAHPSHGAQRAVRTRASPGRAFRACGCRSFAAMGRQPISKGLASTFAPTAVFSSRIEQARCQAAPEHGVERDRQTCHTRTMRDAPFAACWHRWDRAENHRVSLPKSGTAISINTPTSSRLMVKAMART